MIMRKLAIGLVVAAAVSGAAALAAGEWPPPKAPVIPGADGYVAIPNAAMTPQPSSTYRAIFDATRAAEKPTLVVPALNMVGSELNALGVAGTPLRNAKFVVIFHGDAISGILDGAHYKSLFGVANPNLKVIAQLKKAGVELYVCGQNLALEKIDPKTLTRDVTVASDALLVLMTYENKGYALMSF
jgi:intracellular sulfur oxidation DsrE/DsrF family protein